VHGELTGLSGYRSLVQASTVPAPPVLFDRNGYLRGSSRRLWQASFQPGMSSIAVVEVLKLSWLCFQIGCGPEQEAVGILAPNRTGPSLDKGMRKRHGRNGLDFAYLKYSEIGFPLMEAIQRIVIRAEIFRRTVAANRATEHPAQRHSIHDTAVDAEPDNAPRTLVHNNQNPVGSQRRRFASKQIAAPQTVPGVTDQR
jgi:hypothetical protein